ELNVVLPDELIIVHMNEPELDCHSEHFPVRSYSLKTEGKLPLAEARNKAAEKANYSNLVFIDVDCIPAKDLLFLYNYAMEASDKLFAGHVRYLREEALEHPDFFAELDSLSAPDPVRSQLTELSYSLFWSLNFGCSKEIFDQIGGFDTRFAGYGAEDTDFSFSAKNKNVPLEFLDCMAYHQHHASYDPPLNHFEDIIKNAHTFFTKWGVWPMEGWLSKFEALGLISQNNDVIEILRYPSETEIEDCLKR
ncbi:MAG TPA: galactosyltransferase-related protein, partial [Dyadobacter sp.]|nr:galactosyltransferase-related protein [Dyadobacter sp.]